MVADFYAQGMSFKGDPWMIHLALPDNMPKFDRANIIVPLTRPSKWSQLKLLCRLWKDDKGKADYITKFAKAIKPCPNYVAEMLEARRLAVTPEMQILYQDLMGKPMPIPPL